METVRFLRDIDDETAYSQGLELAYVDAFNAVTDVGNRMYRDAELPWPGADKDDMSARHKELRHVLFTMGLVIRDAIDRRRRLANVAAGLPDVVFDEETPEREL